MRLFERFEPTVKYDHQQANTFSSKKPDARPQLQPRSALSDDDLKGNVLQSASNIKIHRIKRNSTKKKSIQQISFVPIKGAFL